MFLKPKSTVNNPPALLYRRFTQIEQSFALSTVYCTVSDNKFWLFNSDTCDFENISSAEVGQRSKVVSVKDNTTILQYSKSAYWYNGKIWLNNKELLAEDVTLIASPNEDYTQYQNFAFSDDISRGDYTIQIEVTQNGTSKTYEGTSYTTSVNKNARYFNKFTEVGVENADPAFILLQLHIGEKCAFAEDGAIYYQKENGISSFVFETNEGFVNPQITVKSIKYAQTPQELLSANFSNIARYQTNKYYFAGSFDFMIKGSSDSATTQFSTGLISPLKTMTIRTFSDQPEISEEDLVVVNGNLYSIESIELSRKQLPKPFNIYFLTLNSIL